MLIACVLQFKGSWDKRLSLVEFTYNIFHSSIGMLPYKVMYGISCRTPVCGKKWVRINYMDQT